MAENVWDYPRPPSIEGSPHRIRVEAGGVLVADTISAQVIRETSHPPVYYLPPGDVRMDLFAASGRQSFCEWKGSAGYWHLRTDDASIDDLAWSYAKPVAAYAALRDHLAFYPSKCDACWVGDERATAQPGDFYGGWITSDLVGPFKGAPGTGGW